MLKSSDLCYVVINSNQIFTRYCSKYSSVILIDSDIRFLENEVMTCLERVGDFLRGYYRGSDTGGQWPGNGAVKKGLNYFTLLCLWQLRFHRQSMDQRADWMFQQQFRDGIRPSNRLTANSYISYELIQINFQNPCNDPEISSPKMLTGVQNDPKMNQKWVEQFD